MGTTVKKLIELLQGFPQEYQIRNEEDSEFIHINMTQVDKVILSTKSPIGTCKDCGDYVYPTEVSEYTGVCPSCDINYYSFEIEELPIKEEDEEEDEESNNKI